MMSFIEKVVQRRFLLLLRQAVYLLWLEIDDLNAEIEQRRGLIKKVECKIDKLLKGEDTCIEDT